MEVLQECCCLICSLINKITGNLEVTENVTANYFIGNGSQLTDIPSTDNSSWNETYADGKYAPDGYGDEWNESYANTLYANKSEANNDSWNETRANDLYVDVTGDTMTGNLATENLSLTDKITFGAGEIIDSH